MAKMTKSQYSIDQQIVMILLGILGIIPLLTRFALSDYVSPIITGAPQMDTGVHGDVFSYYKYYFLLTALTILIGYFFSKVRKGFEIQMDQSIGLSLGLFLWLTVSLIFSAYPDHALTGQYNRHEGTLSYLGYITLFFIASQLNYGKKWMDWIYYAVYLVVGVNAFLGLLYFFGFDLLKTDFGFSLFVPSSLTREGIGNSIINSTMNNPNYVSGFAGMVMPLFFVRAIKEQAKKEQILAMVFFVAALAMELATTSTSGFFTLIVMLPLLLWFTFWSADRKKSLVNMAIMVVASIGVFVLMNGVNPRVSTESIGFFVHSNKAVESLTEDAANKPTVDVVGKSQESPTEIVSKEFGLPPSGKALGSGRLYIWQKTWELIQQRPLVGYGMDNLIFYFPNDDRNLVTGMGTYDIVVTKPHSFYMGLAFGTGLVGLLLFLAMAAFHGWKNLKLLFQKTDDLNHGILMSLFAGWIGYLIQGLFNDSIMGTSPIFWILFGVSVSLLNRGLIDNRS